MTKNNKTKFIEEKLLSEFEKENVVINTISRISSIEEINNKTNIVIITEQKNNEKHANLISSIINSVKNIQLSDFTNNLINLKTKELNLINDNNTFAILFIHNALKNSKVNIDLNKFFNSNINNILNNFISNGYKLKQKPDLGDIVFYVYGRNNNLGEIGIVIDIIDDVFTIIQGITKKSGLNLSYNKIITINKKIDFVEGNGLNLKGFISPII